jgi:hypothetical protein
MELCLTGQEQRLACRQDRWRDRLGFLVRHHQVVSRAIQRKAFDQRQAQNHPLGECPSG